MNKKQLQKILDLHIKWLRQEKGGVRADLYEANLYGADLSEANLSRADLYGADLSEANLSRADLYGADLSEADLSEANLSGANLYGADLSEANLSEANLSRANLYGADLSEADLSEANLSGANLYGADLSEANLSRANLSGANLPTLELAKIVAHRSIIPELGPFYAFKKLQGGVIATLYVPRSAKRVGGLIGRKCRVSKAKVVSLSHGTQGYDMYTGKLHYRVGQWVKPDKYDPDPTKECTNGIHCFITKKEAEDYDG